MTRKNVSLLAAVALTVGGPSAFAQTYFDSIDFGQHPSGGTSGNLYLVDDTEMSAGTADGTSEWRFRNTGPGVPAWDLSAYQIRPSESDVSGYQLITGLNPNTEYFVMIYGIYPANTINPIDSNRPRYGIEVGYDNVNWSIVDNRTPDLSNVHWVDNSSPLGAPLEGPTGDTRFWSPVPETAITDETGALRVYFRAPETLSDESATDRFVLDGIAVSVVPEPSSFALAGLGAAAMLMLRRRK